MLLHVLIWATALMLLVQTNIFCVAYSVDNNNKVSSNKREVKSAFMLDEVADFNEIQEPDEEYNGQRNIMLHDITNLLNNSPAQSKKEVSKHTENYENQQENPGNSFKDKISSRKYVKSLITPKFNVPKDISNNFYLNEDTSTNNKNNKNCKTTIPSFSKIVMTPVVEVNMIPDTTPIPTPSSCNDSLNNSCDKPVQCVQNLNINQQHIQILIQQCKENATTKAPYYNSLCNKHKKFNEKQKSSTSEYYSVTSPASPTLPLPKSTHEFTITSSSQNILHPKYLNEQLRLLSDLTSNTPEKKYFDNPDKRFINFYPTFQERSSSTKNTILKLKELEDEDYVEDTKRTTAEKPENHLRHIVNNIIENTADPAENNIYHDSSSENSLNILEKKIKSKNFLRELSNNIYTQLSNNKIRNDKLKNLQVYDNSDFKPYQGDKTYNGYPTSRQTSMLSFKTNRDDISTIQDYTFAPKYLNYQESSTFSNKENVNNIEFQKAKSRYYFKALQDYELRQKAKEIRPNYFENADRLSYTDFQTNFKPYYPTELPSTNNYELLLKQQNPTNFKVENNDIPYFVNPPIPNNNVPEIDNQQMKFLQKNVKSPQLSNNPTDFRKLYMPQADENYDVQPNFNLVQSITAREPMLNPRKAQLQIENSPSGAYYFVPNYPIYNTGFGLPMKNSMKSTNILNRRRRKNYMKSLFNKKRETNKGTLKAKFRPVRKTRQIHNLFPKPRTCGGYKNDSECKNYLHNADVVLQLVQKLEYALSQQTNNSKCTTTEASGCNVKKSQKNNLIKKRNLPLILPIIFANSRATESAPVINPIPNIQLQVNPELVEKIEAMKLGIENAMSPVSIVKLNDRELKQTQSSKLNPVLIQKLDELKLLIEMVGNIKRDTLRSQREENFKTKDENKFDFNYDIITKRDMELQEKLDEAKLNLVSALKPSGDNRNIFIPNWPSSTVEELFGSNKKNVKFEEKAENDYLYDNYYNDDEYSNVIDHPLQKRNLYISTSTPIPTGIQVQKRTIHLLAMKKLLESIVEIPFFLHQGAENNSLINSVNETCTNSYLNSTNSYLNSTNSYLNSTNLTMSDEKFTSSTPFTIKIEGLLNLSVSSMVSLYTPTLSTENVINMTTVSFTETITENKNVPNLTTMSSTEITSTNKNVTNMTTESYTETTSANITQSKSLETTTGEHSTDINSSSTQQKNKNNTSINSDKIFQDLLLKVLNILSQNALSQFPNFTNTSVNPGKSLNHSVEHNITTFRTTHVVGANSTTTATSNANGKNTTIANTTNVTNKNGTLENTTKKFDKNITTEMTTHDFMKNTTAHKTVITSSTTEETTRLQKTTDYKIETTKCRHKTSRVTTKNPVHIFVLNTHSSLPDEKPEISFFGEVIDGTPSYNDPVIVRKRSKAVESKKSCTTKEYHKTHNCNNQSSTSPESIEGNPIDITKERLSLLLNIIRKSSTLSPTTNCTKRTNNSHTTCSDRKGVEKREVTEKYFGQPKVARSPKNPIQIDTSAMKLISLAEHSLQLAEKYMQNQKTIDSHNVERGDSSTSTQSSFLYEPNYTPNSPHKFKYNLFTPAANFFPMYVVKTPQSNLVSQTVLSSFADAQTSTPSMIITSNASVNYTHTTVVSWPQLSDPKNVTSSDLLQGFTKKTEDKSEIPDYIVPMYSDLEETENDFNSDYSDDASDQKVATSRAERLKRDIKVVDEIQDILDKMKLETRINGLKEGRSVNIKKRSIDNFKLLLPDDEKINSIKTFKYDNPNSKFVKPFDMYVIGNSDLTKDYKKRFLMFKKNHKKRKYRKKKERTWKRLFGRSATKNPEHFLNQQTQNL